jgi:hypothetical protein
MKKEIEKKIEDLKRALKNNLISVNDYCTMFHALHQQLKKLNN